MKLAASTLSLLVGINLIFATPGFAKFAAEQTRQVPISRLLRNLEYLRPEAMNPTDKAMVDFRIGRLHAMAYALDQDQAPCDKAAAGGSKYELPTYGHQPDHMQFKVENKNINSPAAKEHLQKAISHMQVAVKTDPTLATARLGLAWCLEQAGDKKQALQLYRQVFSHAYDGEKNAKGGMYNWSITLETASYLKPLLDPVKDKDELQQVNSRVAQIEKLPRYVTPIMVSLSAKQPLESLLVDHKVSFDLDGFGARSYSKWLTPRAAWLVLDTDGTGCVDSGIKLVGQSSFWLFWKNGFEVLKALDDNHDGSLRAQELSGLALWQDLNSNGKCEVGEIMQLSEFGIVGLKVDGTVNRRGVLSNEDGAILQNGSALPLYDVVLPSK